MVVLQSAGCLKDIGGNGGGVIVVEVVKVTGRTDGGSRQTVVTDTLVKHTKFRSLKSLATSLHQEIVVGIQRHNNGAEPITDIGSPKVNWRLSFSSS